ncbi:MAG: hypothetical protein HXY46_09425 [Syntrophaceae bacterium]|nr:hypothetical protein [Syntrophaceae bacterium]
MRKMRWRRPFWVGMVMILLFSWSYGCGSLSPYRSAREREAEMRPTASTSYRFEDIPLPPGMSLNWKESFLYETRATKTGLLIYEGRGEMEKLSSFFKQEMPKHQWRLLSNFELHNVMLTFVKEGWSSTIYIVPLDGETKRLEIRVGPIELKILPSAKE